MEYPVLEVAADLKKALVDHPVVILQAPPGAGKSTVLPLELMNEGWLSGKKIILLQPRRLAVKAVAARLSFTLGEEVGRTVGYRIRFEKNVSSQARIEVVTEGILTRMIQGDTTLPDVGLLIFDEFHERSLQSDLALALSLQVQNIVRPDLRILLMSATLDAAHLSRVLDDAPVITSVGRQYPVERRYIGLDSDSRLPLAVAQATKRALQAEEGDILVFLPGAGEISRTYELLTADHTPAKVHMLYGDLPMRKQEAALEPDPSGGRKIILATSIAETSLTIQGIRVVIDSGFSRVPHFDARSGLTKLETVRVTRDAADQRAGRAGRLGPGVCYRLWPERTQSSLVPTRRPEILDADLAPLVLELRQWGARNVEDVRWITPPPAGMVLQAEELLEQLGGVQAQQITEKGKSMLRLPTHPRLAHMLLEANTEGEISLAADIAAILEERDPLPRQSGADISLRVEVLRRWRAGDRVPAEHAILDRIEKLAASWRRYFNIEIENTVVADEKIGQLLAAAYPDRIARQEVARSERYKLANGRPVKLPPHDPLRSERWLAIAQLDAGQNEGRIYLAAPIHERDLERLALDQESVRWDKQRGMIVAMKERRVGALALSSAPIQSVDPQKVVQVLCGAIREEGLKLVGWDERHEQWQARVSSLMMWRKENWPDVSIAALLSGLETWLAPYLANVTRQSQLEKLPIDSMLNGLLSWDQQQRLSDLAPERVAVPSGSLVRLKYFPDGSDPVMEVRLQEMFGLPDTPVVNNGRVRVRLHLLSPGYKPVQVTQDLRSFWEGAYHEVRNELKRRYPRHSWPEDPWTAKAVRGAKKK